MNDEQSNTERLIRLLAEHQHELFGYVFSMLLHEEDTRDALQETYVALTRKFAEYDPAKPFLPWAYGFAYVEVLKQRERVERTRRWLHDDVVELLACQRTNESDALSGRLTALDDCLQKLPAADRELISHRYLSRTTVDKLIEIAGGSRRTVFRNLERIRRILHDCITRRVEESAT